MKARKMQWNTEGELLDTEVGVTAIIVGDWRSERSAQSYRVLVTRKKVYRTIAEAKRAAEKALGIER